MKTELKRNIGFNFYSFLVQALNPKNNEVKMVDWFQGKVIIEISKCGTFFYVRSYNQNILDFWLKKFGNDSFIFVYDDNYNLNKLLKETAKIVDAPYIEQCAITKEWIRYEIIY